MTSPLRGDEQKPSEKNDLDAISEYRRGKVLEQVSTVVGEGGRIVIPASYRKTLGIKEGDAVFIRLEGEELHIVSDETEVRRVREMIDRYVPEGVSLVDELIRERRREAAAYKVK